MTDFSAEGIAARKPAKRDFTDKFLRSIKPAPAGKRRIHYDAVVPGFGIRVSDKSTKENIGSFVLVTRFPGDASPTKRRIGDYPAMSLSKAREIAREWRDDIRQGIDPKEKQAERLRKEAVRKAGTFAAAFAEFAEDHLATLRSGNAVKAAVERRAMPQWRTRPISELRRADILALLRTVKHEAGPIAANRLLAYFKKFFTWAVEQDLIEASPAAAVKMPAKANERDRVLTDEEIRLIWNACDSLGPFGRAFKVMLATGQRRNEVGGMEWGEIDQKTKTWRLPKQRTKANRAHEVPLSDLALSIIGECPKIGEVVFTTGRSARGRMAEKGADPVPLSGLGKAKAKLDLAVAKLAIKEAKDSGAEPVAVADWRLHDLRRTFESNLAKLGVARIVGSKILNHAEGGVTRLYDRYAYDAEKRAAMNAWADRLASIVAPDNSGGGNIVKLTSRK